jgi:Kdo2-lipid IVA lauroyltransferase/acyltransferase
MARQVGIFRAWIEYAPLRVVAASLRLLSTPTAVRVGAAAGTLAMKVDRFNRPVAIRNLEIAFPELTPDKRLDILRASYSNWGRTLGEWVHLDRLNAANIERVVSYDGWSNLQEAVKASPGKGALILTAHFGNFELLALAHSIYGNRIAVVYRPLRNPLMDSKVAELRQSFGNRIVPRKRSARSILELLSQDWMVAIPLDLDVRHGVFVDFFSVPACTSDGLARLAMRTGAPVIPAFIVREADTLTHTIKVLPRIEVVTNGDRRDCLRENTQRFTSTIEAMIRRRPDHWNWIHRRWKTRPYGEKRFY